MQTRDGLEIIDHTPQLETFGGNAVLLDNGDIIGNGCYLAEPIPGLIAWAQEI